MGRGDSKAEPGRGGRIEALHWGANDILENPFKDLTEGQSSLLSSLQQVYKRNHKQRLKPQLEKPGGRIKSQQTFCSNFHYSEIGSKVLVHLNICQSDRQVPLPKIMVILFYF